MQRTPIAVAMLALVLAALGLPAVTPATAGAATVTRVDELSPTKSAMWVDSPAMGQVVQVQVLHPAGGGARPAYYLLDGLDPGVGQSTWTNATDAEQLFAGSNVNVVLPIGGQASYYTDWQHDDPHLGHYMWETFLTQELPPLVDAQFDGNGVNAIGGLSMGGNAAYILAARHPALYRAVAGYSACPDSGLASGAVMFSIANRGGNPMNMWGPAGSPAWAEHDPALLAENLRGKTLYLSTGTGIPGPHEAEIKPQLAENIFLGGPVEMGVNTCTMVFDQRMRSLNIPVRIDYSPTGTHSWSYWKDDLRKSWPMIRAAIGA